MELAVATFNIYKHEDFGERLPLILDVLRRARADVVCLQEAPDAPAAVSDIAGALGYGHHAAATFTRPDDGWTEALAVLSTVAIDEREALELRPGVRNGLRVRLRASEGVLDVYNAHLHPRDSHIRRGEAQTLMDRLARGAAVPAIVCGDFNAVPEGPTMAVVWPHLRSAYEIARGHHPETTFPTPLRPLAGRQPGFSERREAPPTDDESQARAAIDYILVRPGESRVLGAAILGQAASPEGPYASDHYGVWARLDLRGAVR